MLDDLTTKADSFYREMVEEGTIEDSEQLKNFLDNLVTYLESTGGKVAGMQYEK